MRRGREVSVAAGIALLVALMALASVSGQPVFPHLFYGTVHINEEPAPAGTVIEAVVDGDVQDSITVTEAGLYGGPGALEEKLLVSDPGTVRFVVEGVEADQTVGFVSGSITAFALTFTIEGFTTPPTPTPTATPSPTETPTPTPVVTASATPSPVPTLPSLPPLVVSTATPTPTPTASPTAEPGQDIEGLAPAEAAGIIETLTVRAAAATLSQAAPQAAAAVIEQIAAARLEELVQEMDEPRLLERLPLVSVAKLSEVSEGVLFESLPNAPVQQIATQKPPVAEPSLPPPSPVRVTDDESVYRVQDTGERVWVALVASPAPLHSALAKFTRRLTDVEVTVAGLDGPPSGAPDPPGQALSSLFSVTVEGAGPDDISAAHVTVSVEKQWLDDNDIHRWSIQLSRLDEDEGEWVPFPTKQVRDEGGLVFYSAVLPGFSVFAVTGSPELPAQVFSVTDLDFRPRSPAGGEDITVRATVTNTGASAARYPASLWIDGTIEATQEIAVAPGNKESFEFTIAKPEGTYRLRVDRLIDQLSVEAAPTPTPTRLPTATPTVTPSPTATRTAVPTATSVPATPTETATAEPAPTATPTPTPAQQATATTARPTATPAPAAPATLSPTPTAPPAAAPVSSPRATPTPPAPVAAPAGQVAPTTAAAQPIPSPSPQAEAVEPGGSTALIVVVVLVGTVVVAVVGAAYLRRRRLRAAASPSDLPPP